MVGPGNALALLAIAVGATAQLTVSEGPFSLWSSIIGLLLLSTIIAYRGEIGDTRMAIISFSFITGYVSLFIVGFLLEYQIRDNGAVGQTIQQVFGPPDYCVMQMKEPIECLVEAHDVFMFCSWSLLSSLAFLIELVRRWSAKAGPAENRAAHQAD